MSAQSPPAYLQNSSHTAALFRQVLSSIFGTALPGTLSGASVGGVINAGDLAVAQNGTPNMSINVAGGQVWIPGTLSSTQALYYGLNDATVNLAIAASSPSNPRIDLVCATVDDAAYSGAANDWKLQVLTGTPTTGATLSNLNGAPALPANSSPLAYVLVPANATTIVTADLKDVRLHLQNLGSRLVSLQGVAIGSLPAAGTVLKEYIGDTILTASAGAATFSPFPWGSFATGYVPRVAIGDGGGGGSVSQLVPNLTSSTLGGLVVEVWTPTGTGFTGSVHMNYHIIGA